MQPLNIQNMSNDEVSELISSLIEHHPSVLGTIQQLIHNKTGEIEVLSQTVKSKFEAQALMPRDIELLIRALSQQYSILLGQIGDVENQLIQAEELKDSIMRAKNTLRIMTLPIALLMDFTRLIKESKWATIKWDEKKDTKCEHITDYARLVEIYVEPNSTWETPVNFLFIMGGYISETAYAELQSVTSFARTPYYTNRG
jgi:hypothetical protein